MTSCLLCMVAWYQNTRGTASTVSAVQRRIRAPFTALNPHEVQVLWYGGGILHDGHWGNYRWLLPFIGHMGICTSTGIIRDFAGPYFVSEDNMAFGRPTKYWILDVSKVYASGSNVWDTAVHDASEEYKHRMHNLCCDNCHSHVAMALNLMRYGNSTSWNMVNLCLLTFIHGRHVSCVGFLKTWLPFMMLMGIILTIALALNLR
uniref:Transmembrane protein 222b n=1 Tax=Oryzias melastigma TaxID=30732 RepID=A0A3B3DEB9_ORYME